MRVSKAHSVSVTFNILYLALFCRMVDIAKYCLLIKHVKYCGFPAKVSVSLKRHNFLRINSRNQPFIYLESEDILEFVYEKNNIILNIQLEN